MFLDCCEKAYALSLTNEDEYDTFQKKTHPMEAYFSIPELKALIGMPLFAILPEMSNAYAQNGWPNYFAFRNGW